MLIYRWAREGNKFVRGLSLGFMVGFVGLLSQALTVATFIIVRIMEPFWFSKEPSLYVKIKK